MLISDFVRYPKKDHKGRIIHDDETCAENEEFRCDRCRHKHIPVSKPTRPEFDDEFAPLPDLNPISPRDLLALFTDPRYASQIREALMTLLVDDLVELFAELKKVKASK